MIPTVSIIIPCFNQGELLKEALRSIESFPDKNLYEIVIVNDGSTDVSTLSILNELERQGMNIINQANKGLGAARNAGVNKANGKYILPLDSDNKIRTEVVLEAIELVETNPSVDVVYGDAEYFGEKTGTWKSSEFTLQRLMMENYIDACALFRKSTWKKSGGYDEKMPVMGYEDWDFWLRIAFSGGEFKYLDKSFFDYRYTSTSMIHSAQKEKLEITLQYLDKKHKSYLNREYLNRLILFKTSKSKKLAFYIFMRSYFPRLTNLLRKAGIINKSDIV